MSGKATARGGAIAAAVAAIAVAAFHSFWWNRFLGVTTDGWFLVYAEKILAGETPYRDFYMYAPPLHALKLSALIAVFGEKIVVIKAWGVLERLAVTAVLCLWVSRFAAPWLAALATITTMVVFSCDVAETLSFYNHDSAYWFLLSAYLASRVLERLERPDGSRSERLLAAAAGACAAASFLAKQTVGLAALVCLSTLLAVFAARAASWRRSAPTLAGWLAGIAAPIVVIWGWLATRGALAASIDQTLLGGTAAKGSLVSTLLRPITAIFTTDSYPGPAVWGALVVLVLALRKPLAHLLSPIDGDRRDLYGLLVAAIALLLFARFWIERGPRTPTMVAVYVAFFGSAAAALEPGMRWLRRSESSRDRQWLLLCGTGFTTAFAFSISWPAFELMVAPGLALVIVWAFEAKDRGGLRAWMRNGAIAACALWITGATLFKLQIPFSWGFWTEPPVSFATETSASPALAGLRLSPQTRDAVDEVVARIQQHSAPTDEIFVFPHMPIFYALADRQPATFAITHWFDVAPDELCREDARRILENPPAVLVMQELSQSAFTSHEATFRNGNPSGQRDLLAAIGQLAQSGAYRELEPIRGPSSMLRTWVRAPG